MKYYLSRLAYNFKLIISDLVTGIGLFWLFIEMGSYSTDGDIDSWAKSIALFFIAFVVILIIVLRKNWPKTTFSYRLRDKDNVIEIKVGDAFKNPGALVVPFNDHLDATLGGNVKKTKSVQNKLIETFYSGRAEHLESDISSKFNTTSPPFDIGTVVEIEQKGKTFYLLVNSKKQINNRVAATAEDLLVSLSQLWTFITKESERNSVVTIPLLGTQNGRVASLKRSTVIKEIIDSYISASKSLNVADKLTISILLDDLKKGNVDMDEIDEYLKFSCQHYKKVTFSSKPVGEEDSASVIEEIDR